MITNLILYLLVGWLIWSVWSDMAKKDGKKEATKAMAFALGLFATSMVVTRIWGITAGQLTAVGILAAGFITIFTVRYFRNKRKNIS